MTKDRIAFIALLGVLGLAAAAAMGCSRPVGCGKIIRTAKADCFGPCKQLAVELGNGQIVAVRAEAVFEPGDRVCVELDGFTQDLYVSEVVGAKP